MTDIHPKIIDSFVNIEKPLYTKITATHRAIMLAKNVDYISTFDLATKKSEIEFENDIWFLHYLFQLDANVLFEMNEEGGMSLIEKNCRKFLVDVDMTDLPLILKKVMDKIVELRAKLYPQIEFKKEGVSKKKKDSEQV